MIKREVNYITSNFNPGMTLYKNVYNFVAIYLVLPSAERICPDKRSKNVQVRVNIQLTIMGKYRSRKITK